MAENVIISVILSTHKQLLVSDENIGIRGDQLKRFSDSSRDKEYVNAQYLQIGVSMGYL